jgi:hypothetical protein
MTSLQTRKLVGYPWLDLFNLVLDVKSYPEFVPHCREVRLLSRRMEEPLSCEVSNKKQRQRDRAVVVPGNGDPCPRCDVPMQIHEYSNLTDKHLHRPYFYTRWFCCMNKSCRTTLVMPERYKVMNPVIQVPQLPN